MLPARKLSLEPSPSVAETVICDADLVIFDCDGVLIDSWDAYQSFFARIRNRLGLAPLTPEQQELVFMYSLEEGVRRFFPPETHDEALLRVKALSWEELGCRVSLEPGVVRLLRALKQSGKRVALDTNAQAGIRQVLERFGLLGYFDMMVTSDDVPAPKPDPQGAMKILNRFDVPTARTVFVGDSKADEHTARRLGIPFWSYCNPDLAAHRYLTDFSQVLVIKTPA